MDAIKDWQQIEAQTSKKFVNEVETYVEWAEKSDQTELLDVSIFYNSLFVSVVIVTSENMIQLIFNKEDSTITIGTASRDAIEHAVSVWEKKDN